MSDLFGCLKCYPRLCHCPPTTEQRIDRLVLALADSVWNAQELKGLREDLLQLLPTRPKLEKTFKDFFNSDDLGSKEKDRLRTQLYLFLIPIIEGA